MTSPRHYARSVQQGKREDVAAELSRFNVLERLNLQENEPEEYINEVSLDSDEQAEPGPPPYESVMMSGYDGVKPTLDTACI